MTLADTVTAEPQERRPSLKVASGLLGVATIFTRVSVLLVLALLTRDAGAASVGYYGLATLTASFVAAGLSLGVPMYLTRDVAAGAVSRAQAARIHVGRLMVLAAATAVAYPIIGLTVPGEIVAGFFLFLVSSVLEQWNDTAWVLIRGTRKAWAEALTNGVAGIALVAVCAADTWLFDGLTFTDAALYFVVIAALRSAAAVVASGLWRQLRTPAHVAWIAQIRSALPYYASDLLGLMYFRGSVFVLALFVSAAQVGEYVAASALVNPAVQVAASMGVGALAYAGRLAGDGASDEPGAIFRFFRGTGFAAAGGLLIGLPLATFVLFGADAGHTPELTAILALFLALRFANYGLSAILLSAGGAGSRLLVLVYSIVGNVVLNVLLAGPFGAYGAAWATVLTELVVAASMLWFIRDRALVRLVVPATVVVGALGVVLVAFLSWSTTVAAVVTGVLFLALGGAGFLPRPQRGVHRAPSIMKEYV
ncbi:polysaccharide biosynthesis C-terminal domain-containing protein [Dactylosporangium sp. NPDC051541]|uniref:polysaccharide biosynthesis C-terminal domain-containing protein n=1 Tax=Dactylosporangium sp. NPDC051541 TaxID=3363977 RepID=UPI003792B249